MGAQRLIYNIGVAIVIKQYSYWNIIKIVITYHYMDMWITMSILLR